MTVRQTALDLARVHPDVQCLGRGEDTALRGDDGIEAGVRQSGHPDRVAAQSAVA
ncbi:hypothetical protein GCM10023145_12200 [Angustibacter luteus]